MSCHKEQADRCAMIQPPSIVMAALASAIDPYMLITPDGKIISFNQAIVDLLAYSEAEVKELLISEIVAEQDWPSVQRVICVAFQHNEGATFVTECVTKFRATKRVSWTITPLPKTVGSAQGALVRLQDVTVQERTLETSRDREFKLSAIVACSPSALSLKTPDGHYVVANPNLQKIHHLPEDSIIGKTDFDLYPREIAEEFVRNDQIVLLSKARHSIEEIVPVDGKLRSFMSHMFPIFDQQGEVHFICRISLDCTEKKEADAAVKNYQEKLEQLVESRTNELLLAKEAAEAANRSKTQFLSTISHEIRNPLGGIKGIADLLSMHKLAEEESELIAIQKSAIQQLSGVLNDVLDYSKIEAGKLELDNRPFDLSLLIDDMAKLKRLRCREKGLEFILITSYEGHPIYSGDSTRVRQVIQNLLSNAYKFTEHGSITLSVKTAHTNSNFDEIAIAVTDTGIGVKESDQQRLFAPFVQASQDERVKAQGTGLGLSIVKSLAEQMNGTVSLQSELGVGSTFTVILRLEIANEAPLIHHHSQATGIRKFRILLVDDENISRKVVAKLLTKLGHEVVDVASGDAAITELKTGSFDIVLTDYSMPDMSGSDLLKAAKELPGISETTKFICLSGYAHKEFIDDRTNEGFDACFSKPLNMEAFGKKLVEYSMN